VEKIVIKAGLILAAVLAVCRPAIAQPLSLVAAENFYGDVAQQIAGPGWTVTSILNNPDEDPHLFEASPSVARALSSADIVVSNGVGYDPWMAKLMGASPRPARQSIVVAELLHRAPGSNPHLWYDPACMPAYAQALTDDLNRRDPAHKAEYDARLTAFLTSLQPLQAKVTALAAKAHGVPVTATEPVFGLMAHALGLAMRNERFQLAVMNDTEPSASDVAAMETDLKQHRVRVLFYNSQATDSAAKRLLQIAQTAHIPVVGVTETEPAGQSYTGWMISQLDALEHALDTRP
jgi:zinc/manganese transport system substrate-binding protein